MRYNVHNIKCIGNRKEINKIKRLITKQVERLERVAENYEKPLLVEIHFNKEERGSYLVSVKIKLKNGTLFLREKDEIIEAAIHILFDKLKLNLAQRINKEREVSLRIKSGKVEHVLN